MRRRSFRGRLRQAGMSLVVGLVMLIVLTLMVVSAVRMSKTNLKVVGNQQAKIEALCP